jgi:exonuclease SbcC
MDEKTFDKFLSAQREKLDKLKIDVNNHKIEIDSLNSQINHWNKIISENLILEKEISKKSSVEYKISMLNDQLTQCNLSIEKIDKEILIIKNSLNQNKILLESIKNKDFQDLKNEIKSLESEAITVEESIYDREKKSGMLQERINNLNSKISDFNSKKSLLNEKNKKISILEKLTKMFGKTGIQTVLLDSIIEDLEKTSNNILKSICNEPSTIVLETQRLGSDGISIVETLDLKVLKDGNLYNFKSLSGGEKFRISLALRIGMSDLSSRYGGSCLEFLMLDEVNSPLDRYGVETLFVNVIKSLENRYKILTITHDESLKEKFDNVINVTKINGESEVEFLVR